MFVAQFSIYQYITTYKNKFTKINLKKRLTKKAHWWHYKDIAGA
ncbi:hypothetical protein VCHA51O444_10546 [Vibrio chagasii]|nr:hypothetical protein VCHA51O444_10546 [Vibrio chagasii]CAH7353339.1 hypothetical protein VCHA53O474_30354 [Vibrio chagasii]